MVVEEAGEGITMMPLLLLLPLFLRRILLLLHH